MKKELQRKLPKIVTVAFCAYIMKSQKVIASSSSNNITKKTIFIKDNIYLLDRFEHYFPHIVIWGLISIGVAILFVLENTRLKKIAQELQESKEKYLIAAKNTDFSVWELDIANRRILQYEHSQEVHGGVNAIDNVPESIVEKGYILDEDIDKFREMYEKVFAGEPHVEGEFLVKSSKTLQQWYERVSYTTIFDKQGKPIKAIGSSKNITKEKEIEKKYIDEIYYCTSVDTDVIGSFHFNLTQNWCGEGRSDTPEILKFQESGTVDGFFSDEYASNVDLELLNKYKNVFNRKNLIKSFNEGNTQLSFDHKFFNEASQTVIWITTFIMMRQNSITKDVEGFIYSRNINNQKVNEQIMSMVISLEYDLIKVIDGMDNSYFLYEVNREVIIPSDKKNNYNGEVIAYAQRFVYEEDKNLYILESSLDSVIRQLDINNKLVVYYRVVEPNGEVRWKKCYYTYIDEKNKTILGTRVDITHIFEREEKKNELLKSALEAAEQANKAKSIFLSSMSHDIRTPMNAIIGMTKLANMDIDDKEKVQKCLKVIDSSDKHLLNIINDILDMSRIESGKLVFVEEEYDLKKLIEEINIINKPMIDTKQQTLQVDLINLEHNMLIGDEVKLKQVLINLLSNANKFTPCGGQITLTIEETISAKEGYAFFRVIIEDNGIGIAKENQQDIFNPFTRVGTGVVNNVEGTGLGLSIVKNIIQASGGQIWVESEVGIGSKFIFEFGSLLVDKLDHVVEDKKKKFVNTKISCEGIKILLIEDNEINVMVATQLFEKLGANVDYAMNGSAGYDKFISSKKGEYDVIFMDIQMPIMNGYEATKAIRESNHEQANTIPIVAMTADIFSEDIAKAHDSGMNSHLGKPVEIEYLCEILCNLEICKKIKND